MIKSTVLGATIAMLCMSGFAADTKNVASHYDYSFPSGKPTPFDGWNTSGVEDKKAAEFAAMFAGKMMTIVTHVENIGSGKRAYVIVGDQHCLIDLQPDGAEFRVIATMCSRKPFGKF